MMNWTLATVVIFPYLWRWVRIMKRQVRMLVVLISSTYSTYFTCCDCTPSKHCYYCYPFYLTWAVHRNHFWLSSLFYLPIITYYVFTPWKIRQKGLCKQLPSEVINALACFHHFYSWQNRIAFKKTNKKKSSDFLLTASAEGGRQ